MSEVKDDAAPCSGFVPLSDFRTTVAAAGRLRGCQRVARARDDVLQHARRSLTQFRSDNEDDRHDAAARRAAADRSSPLAAVSSCHLVSNSRFSSPRRSSCGAFSNRSVRA